MVINNKKNFIYKENFFCIKYYTLSELIDIQNGIISTIEKYKKNNLNDEIINYLNNENSKTPITKTKNKNQSCQRNWNFKTNVGQSFGIA